MGVGTDVQGGEVTEGITQAEASKLISEWLPFTEGREFDI
ncbi:hypothetical protein LCGC14_2264020, partial [marine sediment metagenome]